MARERAVNGPPSPHRRLKDECKRLDYFERACREEERPLLQKLWQQKIEKEKESMAKSFQVGGGAGVVLGQRPPEMRCSGVERGTLRPEARTHWTPTSLCLCPQGLG